MPIKRGSPVADRRLEPPVAGPGDFGRHRDRVARLLGQPSSENFLSHANGLGAGGDRINFSGIEEIDAGLPTQRRRSDGSSIRHRWCRTSSFPYRCQKRRFH